MDTMQSAYGHVLRITVPSTLDAQGANTVQVKITKPSGVTVTLSATAPTSTTVEHVWAQGELDEAGNYFGQVVCDDSSPVQRRLSETFQFAVGRSL